MHLRRAKQLSMLLAILLSLQTAIPVFASGEDIGRITSAGAIVIDFETGIELYARSADVYRATASLTKMMTVYLVYEAISDGIIGFDTQVPISASVISLLDIQGEDNVPLTADGTYSVDLLLSVVLIMSACAATEALAELVGGTKQSFLVMMNGKAEEWGIDAVFSSTYGGSTSTLMTPRAAAAIVRNKLLDYPQVLEKTSRRYIKFDGVIYNSTNKLLGAYKGIDGYKNGENAAAMENFAGTAARGGTRIISVTMGSMEDCRFDDTAVLLDYGFMAMEAYRRDMRKELRLSRL